MTITEDLYEDVDQYQSRSLGVPSTPPPVPSAHPSNSAVVEPIEEGLEDILIDLPSFIALPLSRVCS